MLTNPPTALYCPLSLSLPYSYRTEKTPSLDVRSAPPRQPRRVRSIDGGEWQDVSGVRIDHTRAYQVSLPSGRVMSPFFYDGPISQALAFEGLLNNGEDFAKWLLYRFPEDRSSPHLVHVATDGETYGHHHRGGMALAYALNYIESNGLAKLTNYGQYLEHHPPMHEVEIFENSSWSCNATQCSCTQVVVGFFTSFPGKRFVGKAQRKRARNIVPLLKRTAV